MLEKHGTWSQCVIVFKIILTISCFVSIHWESLFSDIVWSLFFGCISIIQFFKEEHGIMANITPELWCKWNIRSNYAIHLIISSWMLFKTSIGDWLWIFVIVFACNPWTIQWHSHHKRFILPCAVILNIVWGNFSYYLVITNALFILVSFLYSKEYKRLPNSSHACNTIKRVAAYNAMSYFIESVILWQIRCTHRFPYAFRWSPVFIGILVTISAFVWCHLFIKNTSVSRNSIIQRLPSSHDIAFSLQSASKCSICVECLTSLDMESSFCE